MSRIQLTDAEVHDLTDVDQPAAQVRWLKANQWPHVVGNSGRPKVARSFYEFALGPRRAETKVHVTGIDLAALDRVTARA